MPKPNLPTATIYRFRLGDHQRIARIARAFMYLHLDGETPNATAVIAHALRELDARVAKLESAREKSK